MKTIINCEDQTLEISNEQFQTDSILNLKIKAIDDSAESNIEVSLDELFSTLIQFDSYRSRIISLDNQRDGKLN